MSNKYQFIRKFCFLQTVVLKDFALCASNKKKQKKNRDNERWKKVTIMQPGQDFKNEMVLNKSINNKIRQRG